MMFHLSWTSESDHHLPQPKLKLTYRQIEQKINCQFKQVGQPVLWLVRNQFLIYIPVQMVERYLLYVLVSGLGLSRSSFCTRTMCGCLWLPLMFAFLKLLGMRLGLCREGLVETQRLCGNSSQFRIDISVILEKLNVLGQQNIKCCRHKEENNYN